jgi:phosphoglycolate phosphatase-like HAD superfamily hydrolase
MINELDPSKVVFDFDGVLVKSNELKRECFLKVANLYSEQIFDRFVKYCERHPGETRFQKMRWLARKLNEESIDITRDQLVSQYSYCVKTSLNELEYVDNLRELKQSGPSVPWSIVSSAPRDEIQWYLEQRGWNDLFEDGIYGAPRTKAEVFEKEYDTNDRRQMLFIGDSESDFEVAQEYGIDFVFVSQWSGDPWLSETDGVSTATSVADLFWP